MAETQGEGEKSEPAKTEGSGNIKTTAITVLGSVIVAVITTYGVIASNHGGIQDNQQKLKSLSAQTASLSTLPVGTVLSSLLTPGEFAREVGDPEDFDLGKSKWTLADGKSVAGTKWASLRANAPIPNLCGIFLRGKANGKRDGVPEVDLGIYQEDMVGPHQHDSRVQNGGPTKDVGIQFGGNTATVGPDKLVEKWNTLETRPKNVTVNYFIRIND